MEQEATPFPVNFSSPGMPSVRRRAPADLEALTDAIVRLSALAVDLEAELAELDINPLFVMERGKGVKAADALIRPRVK